MTKEEYGQLLMNALIQLKKLRIRHVPQSGLQSSEIHTLYHIKHLIERFPDGVKVTDISKTLKVTPPTVTQQITSLEKKKLVKRIHSKKDRRVVLISITPKGETLLTLIYNEHLHVCIGLAELLGEEQTRQFIEILTKTYNYFQEHRNMKENENSC